MSIYDAINDGDWMAEDRARELRRDVADTPCALCTERISGGATQTRAVLGIPYVMHRECYEAPTRAVVDLRLHRIAERDLAAEAGAERRLRTEARAVALELEHTREQARGWRAHAEMMKSELRALIAHIGDEAVCAPWIKQRLEALAGPPARVVASFEVCEGAVRDASPADVQAFADEQWHGIDPTADAAMSPADRREYIRDRLDRLAAARTPTVHVQGDWDDSEGR